MPEENKNLPNEMNYYSDSKGTGAISSLVFIVFAIAVMVIASYFIG